MKDLEGADIIQRRLPPIVIIPRKSTSLVFLCKKQSDYAYSKKIKYTTLNNSWK